MQFVENWFSSVPSVKEHSPGPVQLCLASLRLAWLGLQCAKSLRTNQMRFWGLYNRDSVAMVGCFFSVSVGNARLVEQGMR